MPQSLLPPAPRILIADDVAMNRALLACMLEGVEGELVEVENGREAVETWLASEFDLVFLDVRMPVMDGLAAVRLIRAGEARLKRGRTPTIIVSAGAPELSDATTAPDVDAVLEKPFTPEDFFRALSTALPSGASRQ